VQFKGWAIAESRVYFLDGKVTELIEHMGGLQSAHEKALLYVAKGRYKIKRIVKTEVGVGVLAGCWGGWGLWGGVK
jgi:hypothetical protein